MKNIWLIIILLAPTCIHPMQIRNSMGSPAMSVRLMLAPQTGIDCTMPTQGSVADVLLRGCGDIVLDPNSSWQPNRSLPDGLRPFFDAQVKVDGTELHIGDHPSTPFSITKSRYELDMLAAAACGTMPLKLPSDNLRVDVVIKGSQPRERYFTFRQLLGILSLSLISDDTAQQKSGSKEWAKVLIDPTLLPEGIRQTRFLLHAELRRMGENGHITPSRTLAVIQNK